MKNIVLDTNILYKEGLTSGRMKVVTKLVNAELIKVYIPDIVKREFITKRVSEITDEVKKIQSSLKSIARKTSSEGEFKKFTNSVETGIGLIDGNVQKCVEAEFSEWIESLSAEILYFNPQNIGKVLDDYFTGSGAFKSLKSREDLPDSMIHHSICQLVDEVGKTYVILADGAFKRGITDKENVVTLDSLNDLLELEDLQGFLSNVQLNEFFVSDAFSDALAEYFRVERDIIEEIYLEGIENAALIDVWHYGEQLNFPSPDDLSDIVISDFYAISESEFTANITFTTLASLSYATDYPNYLELKRDSDRKVDMSSMNGEGICELYESAFVKYYGNINLLFNRPQTTEQIRQAVENLVKDDSQVSIKLDISSAELLEIVAD